MSYRNGYKYLKTMASQGLFVISYYIALTCFKHNIKKA